MSLPLHEHYLLPARVVHAGIVALILSFLFNSVGTTVYLSGLKNLSPTNKDPNQLPISARTVALEIVDSGRYGMKDDNDWASAFPLGHGFVKIGADDDSFYAISMYHQLHCLNSFRKMFNGHRNASRAAHDEMHILHCLTYLRQTMLCGADTTLEPAFFAQNTDGRKTEAAYGVGVTHECRDWVQIREFAEDNYATWKEEAEGFATSEISAQL
ncbi:hypothetical protein BDZ97DRAFT_1734973 [Flammula alnicola]|nr:hypothetical protein BDZ97DRAFT_1734973 [Flammula alnicola]